MIVSVIALFIVTALAVSVRNAPSMRLFLAALACALFVLSMFLLWSESGQPSLTSAKFWKTFSPLLYSLSLELVQVYPQGGDT